jgi:hypothetical protein
MCRRLPLVIAIAALGCASHRITVPDYGILPCPDSAAHELLGPYALQCWWHASHGRWRTLSHESHYDALVVTTEVSDVRDAREIADRFVADQRSTFSEILIYARPDATTPAAHMRRVRWSRRTGFEILDFGSDVETR